jgi:hypothetical protein
MTSYKNVQTFRAGFLSVSSTLKMVAVRSDETTTNFQQDTRRHIPQSRPWGPQIAYLYNVVSHSCLITGCMCEATAHSTQTTCAFGTLTTSSAVRIKNSFNYSPEIHLKNLFLCKWHAIYFNILEYRADQKPEIRFHTNVKLALWNYLEQSWYGSFPTGEVAPGTYWVGPDSVWIHRTAEGSLALVRTRSLCRTPRSLVCSHV